MMEVAFGWTLQRINGFKDTERKRARHLFFEDSGVFTEQTHQLFFFVCVTVNQYCSVSGAITHLYSCGKPKSLPPALCSI